MLFYVQKIVFNLCINIWKLVVKAICRVLNNNLADFYMIKEFKD